MFKKILIANRGEIAIRIMNTCRKLGIKTVAVYSEADKESLHVEKSDEAYLIGGPRVADSYLNIGNIIEIAKNANVDAIHPGYGLLSENPFFAKKCTDEGIVFIGPSSDIIEKMGSKIEARKLMEKAGVPIIRGTINSVDNLEQALESAREIGFPVMLKASAGGGGIGMQIIYSEEELKNAFSSNQKRAESFFGDGTMFLEKYIENPRHIEFQILADKFGNVIHLGERECSIQRRNQKVIEESPSPFLDESLRKEMGDLCVKAVKEIQYDNAGTLEFLVDSEKNYYFLEMNTRLQVEHTVTEEVTGVDIVEEQIRIAAGQPINYSQFDIVQKGHSIEARIYAEDPKTFFPSPGKITKLTVPSGNNVRNEIGVKTGYTVTPYYDAMIAKLITYGNNRDEAILNLQNALKQYECEGIKTNIPFLKDVVQHPQFVNGKTTTNFIDQYIKK